VIWVALALASDVGEVAPLGVGLQLGYPTDISVKYFVNDKAGPSFHLGTSLVWLGFHSRLQWEGQFAKLADGSAASFDLYAVGGLTLNVLFGDDTKVRPGVLGGIGGELRVHGFPLAAYAEVTPVLFPFDLVKPELPPVTVYGGVGVRWHFRPR
jgi:hypothetical protein